MSALAFRNLLEAGDVEGLRAFWREHAPHLPQPETAGKAAIAMHRARTEAESVSEKARIFSHRWLTDRGLPSGLPEHLKPKAERVESRIVSAVGICVQTSNPLLKPAAAEVERALSDAVEDAFANGDTDPAFLKARMAEVRERTWRTLIGV